jgi:glycosyltransferase involved in cell wall biosynthesis
MSTVLSGRRVPIASYIHYLPLDGEGPDGVVLDASLDDGGLGRWVIGAIRTAVESSQTTMIGSAFGAGLLQRWIGQPRLLTIIPPPVEPSLEQLAGVRPAPGPLRLLYNHRLYAHYGTERLFAWIDRAYERAGARLEVWVSDPTRSRSDTRRQLDAASERTRARIEERPYVRLTAATTREQYHQLLGATHACLAPLRNAALWSMSLCDALAAGRPVLAPRRGAYDEILELASSDPYDGPEELVARILDWVERPPEPQAELAARMQRCLGPGAIAERFANALESIRLAW